MIFLVLHCQTMDEHRELQCEGTRWKNVPGRIGWELMDQSSLVNLPQTKLQISFNALVKIPKNITN